ncbi:MAG TPA: menaquinone biosynthesis protein [Candidatus Obscuribacterales bacterium]
MQLLPNTASLAEKRGAATARLGQIAFINCLPVVLPLARGHVPIAAAVTYASPAELNALAGSGALDVTAMSSFFFLQHGGFELLPGVSISCSGPVGSVLFFSKVPLTALSGACVAVPASSATSVNLLRVLLLDELKVNIEVCVELEPSLEDARYEGALVIGDRALSVDADWSQRYWRTDLGRWWLRRTGLPMVFGLWAASSGWAAANREQFTTLAGSLVEAAKMGLSALLPDVVKEAHRRTGLDPDRLKSYFLEQLDYRLTGSHLDGLECFKQLCLRHQLLRPAPVAS